MRRRQAKKEFKKLMPRILELIRGNELGFKTPSVDFVNVFRAFCGEYKNEIQISEPDADGMFTISAKIANDNESCQHS